MPENDTSPTMPSTTPPSTAPTPLPSTDATSGSVPPTRQEPATGFIPPTYHKPATFAQASENPRYQGKMVVAVAGEVYGTQDEEQLDKLVLKLSKKYPDKPIEVGYIASKDQVMVPTVAKMKNSGAVKAMFNKEEGK